jgi:hypothetical protein
MQYMVKTLSNEYVYQIIAKTSLSQEIWHLYASKQVKAPPNGTPAYLILLFINNF